MRRKKGEEGEAMEEDWNGRANQDAVGHLS